MVNLVTMNAEGHKVGLRITDREQYFEARNTVANRENFVAARAGDDNAKRRLVQFNYNDQLSDGILAGCHTAASTFGHDIDCGNREECLQMAQGILGMKDQLRLLELSVSARWGLHAVCLRQPGKTILENQIAFALLTHTEMDCNAHDQQRVMFTGPADEDTLLFLDDRIFEEPMTAEEGAQEYARLKEREQKGLEELPAGFRKGEKHYRPWDAPAAASEQDTALVAGASLDEVAVAQQAQPLVFSYPVANIISTLYPQGVARGHRHNTMLALANDLMVMLDGDSTKVGQALLSMPWVQEVVKERGKKEVDDIVDSARKLLKKRESDSLYPLRPSRPMQQAIETLTKHTYTQLVAEARGQLMGSRAARQDELLQMLEKMGGQLKRMSRHYKLLRLLFHQVKPKQYVAALFVAGAFYMTLMTRCWYRFWPTGNQPCRLNSILELIGRFASGKRMAVHLYRLIMEPVAKADEAQVAALNKWKEQQMLKAASQASTPCPQGIYRHLPAESSSAAIREAMFKAHETIDDEEWPLHVSIFDSELENTLMQKTKSHMDQIMTLWLKSFHNEPHGSYLKTINSIVGEFDVFLNCVYTGTEYSLRKQVTAENYGTGLVSRITAVPMGDSNFEMMEKKTATKADELCERQINDWAYKLDSMKGEIPCENISEALREWTERRMEEAREEQSLVMEDLLKRPCWHAINFSLPFIVSRHWTEVVADKDGRLKCGPAFKTDKTDVELALFIANAQYYFQLYYFGDIGEQFYANEKILGTSAHQPLKRTMAALRQLPEFFGMDDVERVFELNSKGSVTSRLSRMQADGLIQRIRRGEHKGQYKRLI